MMAILYNEILCERPNSAAVGAYSTALGNGATKAEASKAASEAVDKSTNSEDNFSKFKNNYIVVGETDKAFKIVAGYEYNENAIAKVVDLDNSGKNQKLFYGYEVAKWVPKSQIEGGRLKDWVRKRVIIESRLGRNRISNIILI